MAPEVSGKVGNFQLVSGHSQSRPRLVPSRITLSPSPNLLVPLAHRLEDKSTVFVDPSFNTPLGSDIDLLDNSDPNLNLAVDPSFTDLAHRSPVSCLPGPTSTQSHIPTSGPSASLAPTSSHYIAYKTA